MKNRLVNAVVFFSMSWVIALTLLLVSTASRAESQNDIQAIKQTLNDYIQGTSFSNAQQIQQAFHPEALLLLSKKDKAYWPVNAMQYASWFSKKPQGTFTGRIGEILNIDIAGDIATAKAEILLPAQETRFIDMFLLKKIEAKWQILSKTATKTEANNTGDRVLFIVSNAHYHGNSQLPAGVSYSEIVNAYDTFIEAGYTVDFVSPEGGAIPLAYINTSNPDHKRGIYNNDLMFKLKTTLAPDEIAPSRYRAVHYVGGSAAMYGVAENKAIQRISMEIYEQHNGIISSVCHGTAGIVNLKTKDGEYLVKDRRISGYPDAWEKEGAEYFKQFPFKIQETIEARKGTFLHGDRNASFVQVDGRIVTGTNFQSSADVAKAMIKLMKTI